MSVVYAEESGFSGLFSFEALFQAYLACRIRKRQTFNAQQFEQKLLDNLFALHEELESGTYQPSRSVCFVVTRPKHREIFAADFRDRVVHHLLVPQLEAVFEPKFIHDSYACRLGKGTHAAVDRLQQLMQRARARKPARPVWFLQLDIRSFFMAIDKQRLLSILARHVENPQLLTLAHTIIMHDATTDYVRKGPSALHRGIPPHKSLFGLVPGKGLPIGNLTSQFFANVYLNELDQFVKHQLKVKGYLRYVDDFVLLDNDPAQLLQHKQHIADFLDQQLALELKPDFVLKRTTAGADFLGYIVRPDYRLVRNRVIGNLRAKLNDFQQQNLRRGLVARQPYWQLHLRTSQTVGLRQTFASYLGHFRHANSFRLTQALFRRYPWLSKLFLHDAATETLIDRLAPLSAPATLAEQYVWFRRQFHGFCLFFQVGRFVEFYTGQARAATGWFGLKPGAQRRGAFEQCGFPLRLLKRYKQAALQQRISYVVVAQTGELLKTGLQKRTVTEILTFTGTP